MKTEHRRKRAASRICPFGFLLDLGRSVPPAFGFAYPLIFYDMADHFINPRRLRRKLSRMIREKGETLFSFVAESILENEDPVAFLSDVTTYGCASGSVPGLIYYADTHAFFDRYYEEIEVLRREFEESCGVSIRISHDLKNDLAWFSYELTAHRILDELNAS